jgi:DNA mismatch repair protein MutL
VTIQILPPAVRQRIAAGEVIERPACVVKELVENAIDAGARAISVEVRNGGLSLIRVSDDGTGMGRADAQLALERFATSKVHSMSDLEGIRTLGFRGEALSSIAAVAQVEILTRAEGEIEGTRVEAAGEAMQVEPAASPIGTSVTVRDLFSHVPARRRFLKSRTREEELIQQTVDRYALAYPHVAFRAIVGGRERLVAPPGTLLERIGTVLGRDVAGEMVFIEWEALDLRVQGYISRPTIGRSRRDAQYFSVNGRPVRAGLLAVMVERPYSQRLPAGRYPLAVVEITIAPHYVDANVHPRKAEVRFAQERTIYSAVSAAVEAALSVYPRQTGDASLSWPFASIVESAPDTIGRDPYRLAETLAPYGAPPGAPAVRALSQLHYTYILAQTPDGLAIVDQHAAHEQVLFEQLERGGPGFALSPPARLDLTPSEVATLERVASTLEDLGIEVEPFGGPAFLVRTLPAALKDQDPAELITVLIAEATRWKGGEDRLRETLAMKAACQGAVKAGDPLAIEQMQRLLDELAEVWSPATCPHGRPALVSISLEELAQRFGR